MSEHAELRLFFKKVLVVAATLLVVWLLVQLRAFVIYFLLSVVLSAALTPIVEQGEARRVPRVVTVGMLVAFGFVLLGLLGLAIVPTLIAQGEQLARLLPDMLMTLPGRLARVPQLATILPQLSVLTGGLQSTLLQGVAVIGVAATSVGNIALISILTLFVILDAPRINRTLLDLLPTNVARPLEGQMKEMEQRLAMYVLGTVIVSGLLAVCMLILLLLLGVPYALLLSIIVGLIAIVPMVGSLIGMLPAAAVAFFVSPWKALYVVIGFLVINHVVSNFIGPLIFQRSVNLHPLVVIFALALGAQLGGLGGALVAVPVAAALQVLVVNLYLVPKLAREGP